MISIMHSDRRERERDYSGGSLCEWLIARKGKNEMEKNN